MGCLYCGKEIGAFRQLRGDEFCTPAHRKLYGERLGKALDRIREPEPAVGGIAGFRVNMPLAESARERSVNWGFIPSDHPIAVRTDSALSIPEVLGTNPKMLARPSGTLPAQAISGGRNPEPVLLERHLLRMLPVSGAPRIYLQGLPDSDVFLETYGTAKQASAPASRRRVGRHVTARPEMRLPAMTLTTAENDAIGGRGMPDPPASRRFRRVSSPSIAHWHSHPAAHPHFADMVPTNLPRLRAEMTGKPQMRSTQCWLRMTVEPVLPAAKPSVKPDSLAPIASVSGLVQYPDVARILPSEDLLPQTGVAAAGELVAVAGPAPVAPSAERMAALPEPSGGSLPPAFVAPAMVASIGITGIPAASSDYASLTAPDPHRSAAAEATPLNLALPWVREPRSLRVDPDLRLAGRATSAPFAPMAAANPQRPTRTTAAPPAAHMEWTQSKTLTTRPAEFSLAAAETAPFAASASPVPVLAMTLTAPFTPEPMAIGQPICLPAMLHRVRAAQPAAAPPTVIPPELAGSDHNRRLAEGSINAKQTIRLPRFVYPAPAAENEARPLVPRPVAYNLTFTTPSQQPIAGKSAAAMPRMAQPQRTEFTPAGFGESYPQAHKPSLDQPNAGLAALDPLPTLPASPAAIHTESSPAIVPEPTFIPIEYYCQRASGTPRFHTVWQWPVQSILPPGLDLALAEEQEEQAAQPEPPKKVTEIFSDRNAKWRNQKRIMAQVGKIAACLLVATFMWFGMREITITGRSLLPQGGISAVPVETARIDVPAPAKEPAGFFDRVRMAIGRRAAVEMTDDFHTGMQAWGAGANSYAQGWSHNAAGWVRPGELALYKPTSSFTNYRLEFFGQIENKGMGWVMRGQDKQNYYAMKFQVVQAGARPFIALVHYPVSGGVKGRKMETPLNVMVHQSEPFHVSVDVSGNRFTASVEGQKIDSWTDETPASGAAGFFAEANERARLYWMKVTRNDDWLGNVCSFLSGGNAQVIGMLMPGGPGEPRQPGAPVHQQDVILAEAEESSDFGDRQGAQNLQYRRNRWNS